MPPLFLAALLAVLLGSACRPELSSPPAAEPAAVPPPVQSGSGAGSAEAGDGSRDIADPDGACSAAAIPGDLAAQEELPAAVAATRAAVFQAAVACDFAALDALAPPELRYTFGEHRDLVTAWRRAEAEGEPVLRWMAEVLRRAPAHEHGLWIWPAFFTRTVDRWSAADRDEARRLLGPEELREVLAAESYLGYRLGIADDGRWQYFVAGD